jgi:hypothetical protein
MTPGVAAPPSEDRLRGALLPILHAVQTEFGCIDPAVEPVLADALNLSTAEVHSVVTFYRDFRRTSAGRTTVRICRLEACQAVGSDALAEHAQARLGVVGSVQWPCTDTAPNGTPIMHMDGFVQGHRHAGGARGGPGGRDPRRNPGDGWPVTDPAVRLAANIALQFRPRPPVEAAAAIAEHIPAFWDPRMRRALLTAVAGGADLGPLVRDAAPTLRSPS